YISHLIYGLSASHCQTQVHPDAWQAPEIFQRKDTRLNRFNYAEVARVLSTSHHGPWFGCLRVYVHNKLLVTARSPVFFIFRMSPISYRMVSAVTALTRLMQPH